MNETKTGLAFGAEPAHRQRVAAMVNALRYNMVETSTGQCARHVRLALSAGGFDVRDRPTSACDYGPFLLGLGWRKLPDTGTQKPLRPGDVVVLPALDNAPHGHVAMYDGEHWISDFRQRDIYAGPAWRLSRSPLALYRFPGAPADPLDAAEEPDSPGGGRTWPLQRAADPVKVRKTTDYRFNIQAYSHLVAVAFPTTANFADGPCDGLIVNAPGVASLIMADGAQATNVPLQAGYNPVRVLQVTAFAPSDSAITGAIFAGYCWPVPLAGQA